MTECVARYVEPLERARVAAFLGELVGAQFDETDNGPLRAARQDPLLMGDQIRRAFEDWLAAQVHASPVMMILEDLHGSDVFTFGLLDAALRNLAHEPLLVVGVARPDVHASLPATFRARAVEIALGELTAESCAEIARTALGARATPEVVERIGRRSKGHPFHLEELIRAEAEGIADDETATARTLVAARLERAPPAQRLVLKAASVFGRAFPEGGVGAILEGRIEQPVGVLLSALEENELVATPVGNGATDTVDRKTCDARDGGVRGRSFRHEIVRDAAYASLADDERIRAHLAAGRWLAATGEVDGAALADHFERGGAMESAVDWYRAAADQALEANDFAAAITRADRGVACGAKGAALGALRLAQARAHRWRNEHMLGERRGVEAMRCLPRTSPAWCVAAGETAVCAALCGHYEHLIALGRELAAAAPTEENVAALIVACARTATWLYWHGRNELADTLMRQIAGHEADVRPDDFDVHARIHYIRATEALCRGDPLRYRDHSEIAAVCFERAGNLRSLCVQRQMVAAADLQLGRYTFAEGALRAALAHGLRMGVGSFAADARHSLAIALLRQGKLEEARDTAEQALSTALEAGSRRHAARAQLSLANARRALGDLARALEDARAAVATSEGVPNLQASALATVADLLLVTNSPDALTVASEALAVLERLRMVEDGEALVRVVHAEALLHAGRTDEAATAAAVAHEKLLARAEKIADPEIRRTFLEVVPENARTVALAHRLQVKSEVPV